MLRRYSTRTSIPKLQIPNYHKLTKILSKHQSKPLSLTYKILYAHAATSPTTQQYLKLLPDRVAMQDASAQMALLQFMLAHKNRTAIPASIHCDHLIAGKLDGKPDLASAVIKNKEIFDFLGSTAKKYGIDFWGPGSGIIHQIVLENYAVPGGLILGTDSHTPNAGGLGGLAIGVGGADAVDGLAGIPWELKAPKVLGIELVGKLNGWASPKDMILKIAGMLTVSGATNHVIEYFGEGVDSLSATGMATICNMGAEVGATTSLFPYNKQMEKYLNATNRSHIAQACNKAQTETGFLNADKNASYDSYIKIDLSQVEPYINGPFTPDAATPISEFKALVKEKGWKDEIGACLIGSCTNSSYEDMTKASSIASQAISHGLKSQTPFLVTPGSAQIHTTIQRDGQSQTLSQAGGKVLANACGPCIGQWDRSLEMKQFEKGQENSIMTSFNRNFRARNDGNAATMNFIASPEIVTAMSFSGKLSFNPLTDSIPDKNGTLFKFTAPNDHQQIDSLPSNGFISSQEFPVHYYSQQPPPNENIEIVISPNSTRLQALTPFDRWDGKEFSGEVLVKVQGKCTTDHISAAGAWLKYKGHLDNIANNTLIGAKNAFNGEVNLVYDFISGKEDSIPNVARNYKLHGKPWMIIADTNYGEGSAREHAALQPRYLGCRVVLARSFARIHETNLKKQGIIPLTFVDASDYDKITGYATVKSFGVVDLLNGNGDGQVELEFTMKEGGGVVRVRVSHTLSEDQIGWIKAGSALNLIAAGV